MPRWESNTARHGMTVSKKQLTLNFIHFNSFMKFRPIWKASDRWAERLTAWQGERKNALDGVVHKAM